MPAAARRLAWTVRLVLAAGLCVGAAGCEGPDAVPAGGRARARRGTFEIVLTEDGKVRAAVSFTIMSPGRGEIEWLVAEGARVQPGDMVVRLKVDKYQDTLDRLDTELTEASKRLEELLKNREIEARQAELEVQSREVSRKLAELRRKELQSRPTPDQLDIARQDRLRAEVDLTFRKRESTQAQTLFARGIVTAKERADKRLGYDLAQATFAKARTIYQQVEAGATELDLRRARISAEAARLDWQIAKAAKTSKLAGLNLRERNARRQIDQLEQRIAHYRDEIAIRQIKAPREGLVVYREHHRHKIKEGDRVWRGIGILELPDMSRAKVETQISERHVHQIRKGMPVRVRIHSLGGRVFAGHVARVDAWAHDKNENLDTAAQKKLGLSGTKVFDVEVEIDQDNSEGEIKLGFKAQVEFPLQTLPDVVSVDKRCIFSERGRYYVRVVSGSRSVLREVELGPESQTEVVVSRGLSGGEEVLLRE